MPLNSRDICYGCLFCKTGGEKNTAEMLMREIPELEALVPMKERVRRKPTGSVKEYVILFPGYVFFAADARFEANALKRKDNVYRLLMADKDDWRIFGEDRRLVSAFFENKGVIGLSKAYYEGDRIRIAEGFMKDYEGMIVRVNRRNQTAQIRMDFSGRRMDIWLGFELMESAEPQTAAQQN